MCAPRSGGAICIQGNGRGYLFGLLAA